jgi:alkylation response protein AidB-like acyl-CoA dehydrogenase
MTTHAADPAAIQTTIEAIAREWVAERPERQRRRELDPADFARLAEAGFLLTGVPVDHGGIVESVPTSTRAVAGMLRTLARGDSSVALVASMHPAVLYATGWLPLSDAPQPHGKWRRVMASPPSWARPRSPSWRSRRWRG